MAKVIGIAGSPRRNGNSATLMRSVLRGAALAGSGTSEVFLNGLTYKGCQGCTKCSGGGTCILDDELTPVIHDLMTADGWVLAAPIYYDGVSGQLKSFFDRCRTLTRSSTSTKLEPQLTGDRRAVIVVTYEDKTREDYYKQAKILESYLSWMGEFSSIEIICEGKLGPQQAAHKRPELLISTEEIGKKVFHWT